MSTLTLLSFLFTLAVAISYLNYRFIHLQSSIAITMTTAFFTLCIILLSSFGINIGEEKIMHLLSTINFHDLLMNGMLSFMLFAGALHLDFSRLRAEKWEVSILAVVGTLLSTAVVALLTFYFLAWMRQPLDFIYCLLFGAVISPTDPIAVLSIFKKLQAPKSLDTRLTGESLFNDGIAIVIFVTLYSVAYEHHPANPSAILGLFVQQALGGIFYGALLGMLSYWLIKPIDDALQEIFITLAIATGGYSLAQVLNISGPLAMVVAGLFLGNHKKMFYMSEKTRHYLINFWDVMDHAFNAILFLLIGMELIAVPHASFEFILGLGAIVIVLIARTISVGIPLNLMKLRRRYEPYAVSIMIWGGLRGGLAIALALALPNGQAKTMILPMTYATVLFSIVAQGLSIGPLIRFSKNVQR